MLTVIPEDDANPEKWPNRPNPTCGLKKNSPHKNKIHEKLHLKRKWQILDGRRMGCLVGPAFSYKADVSEGKRKEGKHKASFGAFYYMISVIVVKNISYFLCAFKQLLQCDDKRRPAVLLVPTNPYSVTTTLLNCIKALSAKAGFIID